MALKLAAAACLAVIAAPLSARAADMPALVTAYANQLAQQCGPLAPGAAAPNLVDRVDLNGDKRDDWVVDAGRYPCPSRPAVAAAAGAQVTLFMGVEGGVAVPALQYAAFGSHLQRAADGTPTLWLTLGGADCDSDKAEDRCERRVVWRTTEKRFDLIAPGAAGQARR